MPAATTLHRTGHERGKDTASVSLNYATTVMTDWRVTGRAAYSFVGSSYDVAYYFGYKLPSYSLVNARVGLGRGNWDGRLYSWIT